MKPSPVLKFRKPMLAKSYEGHEGQVSYPCYAQPKVDGVRCITDGRTFWSRNGKLFPQQNFDHLRMMIRFPYLLDGELSLYGGGDEFEEVVSVVKRAGHKDSHRLMFCAFDLISDKPYFARKQMLQVAFESRQLKIRSERWQRLLTKKIKDEEELRHFYQWCLEGGHEGIMVRSAFGLYTSTRSIDLMKWKPLKDDEFEIVDVKEAKGKDKGTPIFVCCVGPKSVQNFFRARPMGTTKQRRKMWRERKQLIGKMLTVEYQNLTRYGVPRFPRAKVLRDYE